MLMESGYRLLQADRPRRLARGRLAPSLSWSCSLLVGRRPGQLPRPESSGWRWTGPSTFRNLSNIAPTFDPGRDTADVSEVDEYPFHAVWSARLL